MAGLELEAKWAVPFVSRCSGKHRAGTLLPLASEDWTQNMHNHATKK